MKRRDLVALTGALAITGGVLAAWATGAAGAIPAYISAAVADSGRSQDDRDLDAARKPAEILAFIGVKPGEKVVDVFPGKELYFTKLFSVAVGPSGKVYDFIPDEIAKLMKTPLPDNGAAFDPNHPNVTAVRAPANAFATPEPVDVVWIRQNYHDLHDPFMAPTDIKVFNAAVFKALKPGGEYVVLDHSAADGTGLADTNTLHRIDAAAVKSEVTAAGFTFESESDILRNPADPRTAKVFDDSIRGRTDQFIYRFRKPG